MFDCITLEMIHSSFNHTAELFNKIYNRSKNNEFIGKTLDDITTRNSDNIRKDIKKIAEKILTDNNFDCETGELIGRHTSNKFKALPYIDDVDNKTREDATLFINEHNTQFPDRKIDISEIETLETDLDNVVYVSMDDVLVPHQREKRAVNGNEPVKTTKYVKHTNIWIKVKEFTHNITADSTLQGCLILLAFLLKNNLLEGKRYIFITDGAKEIKKHITDIFSQIPSIEYKIYLDWYHLCKRVEDELSYALKRGKKNKEKNDEINKSIFDQLWTKNTDTAINIIKNIEKSHIRDKTHIDILAKYLDERRNSICCYALRNRFKLLNSSNRVESLNYGSAGMRQKHRCCSWGYKGSHGLASITTLKMNDEFSDWLSSGTIRFSMGLKEGELAPPLAPS